MLARLTNTQKVVLATSPHGSVPALLEDCLAAAVDAIVAEHVPGQVRTPSRMPRRWPPCAPTSPRECSPSWTA